jgi:hypothetical protein
MISVRMWSRPPTTVPQLGGSYGTVAKGVSGLADTHAHKRRQNRSVQLSLRTIAGQACRPIRRSSCRTTSSADIMTASQRVMATALIHPEPANISKNATKNKSAKTGYRFGTRFLKGPSLDGPLLPSQQGCCRAWACVTSVVPGTPSTAIMVCSPTQSLSGRQRTLITTFCLLIIWSNRYDVPTRLGNRD